MRYLITTDTHFFHNKMIEYGRPSNYEELIYKGFEILEHDDCLIHLGDVCIGKDEICHDKLNSHLNCKKILVLGNHDHKTLSWYMKHGWDFVCNSFSLRYGNKNILFSHKPQIKSGVFDMNIHGHFHRMDRPERIDEFGSIYDPLYHKLISLESNKYTLTDLQSLIN